MKDPAFRKLFLLFFYVYCSNLQSSSIFISKMRKQACRVSLWFLCMLGIFTANNLILAAVHSELDIWNIQIFSKYFHNLYQSKNIWIHFLRALVNWSPQIGSHPFRSLFELQLILWQFTCCRRLFSTRTQIWIESETVKEISSKYFHLK